MMKPASWRSSWRVSLFLLLTAAAARAAEPNVPVPQLYGLYTWPEEYVTHAQDVKEVGIRWLILSGVSGATADVDKAVLQAAKDGVHVVLMLHNGRSSIQQLPQDLDKYRQYVRACIGRYGVGGSLWAEHPEVPAMPVRFWKVWGEPNIGALSPPDGVGRPELYAQILKTSSQEIRKADPKSTIIAFNVAGGIPKSQPGMDSNYQGLFGWRRFIKEVAAAVGPDAFDVVGMHPYTQPQGPEAGGVLAGLDILAEVAKEGGFAGKAVWFPEVGYPIAYSNNKQVRDVRQQAAFLVRLMAVSGAHGVVQVDTFYVVDHIETGDKAARRFGLFLAPGKWREQARALQVMIRLVPDPKREPKALAEEPNAVFAYRFQGTAGPVVMAWNSGPGEVQRELPFEGKTATLVDMLGKTVKPLDIAGGKVKLTLGEAPVYVVPARKEEMEKLLGPADEHLDPAATAPVLPIPPVPAAPAAPAAPVGASSRPAAVAAAATAPATARSYALVTDLDANAGPVVSIRRLLGAGAAVLAPSAVSAGTLEAAKDGAVVLLRDPAAAKGIREAVQQYAAEGHTVFADLAYYAASRGAAVKTVQTPGIRVAATSPVTAGLHKDDTLPYCGKGKLSVLAESPGKDATALCAAQEGGAPAVIEEKVGKGRVVAADLQTPEEPYTWDAGSFHKYLFLANALGNPVRFGELYPGKPKYEAVVGLMRDLAKAHPAIHMQEEGNAAGGDKIYSLSAGKAGAPGVLIFSVVHGNEWENGLGLIRFARLLAEDANQAGIDLSRTRIKLVPVMNPSGYEKNTRQNGRQVDLNRNGELNWDKIKGEVSAKTGQYGPGSYDWKGEAPLSEPELQTFRNICESGSYSAFLDIHGNPSGTGYNKSLDYAAVGKADGRQKTQRMRDLFNASVAGRFVLRQQHEKEVKPLVIESVGKSAGAGGLLTCGFACRDKYGVLVELPAGIYVGDSPERSGYGTLVTTDLVTELCVAFVGAFAADGK